jgi:hypothetical protein
LAWYLRRARSWTLSAIVGAEAATAQPWFFLVTVILIAHGALAAFFSLPVLDLLQENIRLLQSWGVWEGLRRGGEFSGLALVPAFGILLAPGLAALAAIAFIAGAIASLGHLFLALGGAPRVILRSICLQIAFLLGLFFTEALFEAGSRLVSGGVTGPEAAELKARVLPWLAGQTAVLFPLASRLACLLPGFFLCAAIVFRKAREKELGEKEMPFPEETAMAESAPPEMPGTFLETDERFKDETYFIKWKFFSNPFYKVFEVYDSDSKLAFVARMNGLSLLTRAIKVQAAGKEKEETLSIVGRRFILFPNLFDITYCPTNKTIGTFKNSPAGWMIMDGYGRRIALLKSDEAPLGTFRYQILMGRLSVGKYMFQNLISPTMVIDFPDDSAGVFDKKLGIGLALVLSFKAVAFNYQGSHSN